MLSTHLNYATNYVISSPVSAMTYAIVEWRMWYKSLLGRPLSPDARFKGTLALRSQTKGTKAIPFLASYQAESSLAGLPFVCYTGYLQAEQEEREVRQARSNSAELVALRLVAEEGAPACTRPARQISGCAGPTRGYIRQRDCSFFFCSVSCFMLFALISSALKFEE